MALAYPLIRQEAEMVASVTVVNDLKRDLLKQLPAETAEAIERSRDILKRLDECTMTLDILTETLIGKEVNKLKSHEKIGREAKALIKKWKKIAAAEKEGNGGPSTEPAPAKRMGMDERRDSMLSVGSTGSAFAPESEWEDLPPNRQNIAKKLYEFFLLSKPQLRKAGVHPSAVEKLTAPRAAEIEGAIHEAFSSNPQGYSDKARSLAFNLKKNKELTVDVVLGQVSAKDLVKFSTEQLASAEARKAREEEAQKHQDSKRLDWEQANEDKINEMCGIKGDLLKASLFTCGRCKSTKTTSTQKQTRSADEPMTVFVLCMNCGKRWRC